MSVFCDLINEYNIKLKELTNLFNINFIDTNSLASTTGKNNFHISTKGHIDLANIILTNIYKNIKKTKIKRNLKYCTIISNNGIKGIKEKMKIKYIDIMKQKYLNDYEIKRQKQIGKEYLNEIELLEKILNKI